MVIKRPNKRSLQLISMCYTLVFTLNFLEPHKSYAYKFKLGEQVEQGKYSVDPIYVPFV